MTKTQVISALVTLGVTDIYPDGRFQIWATMPNGSRGLFDPRDLFEAIQSGECDFQHHSGTRSDPLEFVDECGPLPTCQFCGLAVGVCECHRSKDTICSACGCSFSWLGGIWGCGCDPEDA